ncbi:MAG: prepilin-type N-terminal cleavage/methylation domain-containing protein [Sandaracinobacteroides sp.]
MRRSGERGFTLVELLVTLVILSLMAGVMAGSIGFAGIVGGRAGAEAATTNEVVNAQRTLRTRIEALIPTPRLTASDPQIEIEGSPDRFAFVAPPAARQQPDAPASFRLQLSNAGDLVLRSSSTLDPDAGSPAAAFEDSLILRRVAAVRIAYFGRDMSSPTRRWLGFWRDRPQPPELVRISVDFPAGDGRKWPDLVVRPRASVNTLCRIDALTGRCEGSS